MKRKHILRRVIIGVLAVIVITLLSFVIYTGNYYEGKDIDKYFLNLNNSKNTVNENEVIVSYDGHNNIWFEPAKSTPLQEEAFVFYPGGLVDSKAYAPIMYKLASDGYVTCIVDMPFKLAFFNANGANSVIDNEKFSSLDWYIGGHSLGGVFASRYYLKNSKRINGLVLMASYSDKDLSSTGGKVLSMYGSNDNVLKFDNYNKNKSNLCNLSEYVIEGGNHSYFGSYGLQKGDKEASISCETQWEIAKEKIEEFMEA